MSDKLDAKPTVPNNPRDAWMEGYRQALEDAAAECERHAAFCKEEAHKGGSWNHLITRADEAIYNAHCIRLLKSQGL